VLLAQNDIFSKFDKIIELNISKNDKNAQAAPFRAGG